MVSKLHNLLYSTAVNRDTGSSAIIAFSIEEYGLLTALHVIKTILQDNLTKYLNHN